MQENRSAVSFNLDHAINVTETWLQTHLLTWFVVGQLSFVAVALGLALLGGKGMRPKFDLLIEKSGHTPVFKDVLRRLRPVIIPLIATCLVWAAYFIFAALDAPAAILRIAANLLTAWVVIRLLSGYLRQRGWATLIAGFVWLLAALAIIGWLKPLYDYLNLVTFDVGTFHISILGVIRGAILLGLFLIISGFTVRLIDDRMARLEGITPAGRVLFIKILRVLFIIIAILIAMTSIGIDFTAIAIFSGAIGIGIGFGLQKVVSNLLSGILLLMDRSLKPGDVIEIGDAYGWIEYMGARYITVATRDGKEYLIPNEDIITQQVINWSYSNRSIRIKIKVGISYGSDVHKAMDLMIEAAGKQKRVLTDEQHKPQARLVDFGNSSVDLELRIWVMDPEQGMVNVTSDIRLAIWDSFHANNIEFPFPQRDLHISSAKGLEALADKFKGL